MEISQSLPHGVIRVKKTAREGGMDRRNYSVFHTKGAALGACLRRPIRLGSQSARPPTNPKMVAPLHDGYLILTFEFKSVEAAMKPLKVAKTVLAMPVARNGGDASGEQCVSLDTQIRALVG